MSKEKMEVLRREIHALVVKSQQQEVGFSSLMKMLKEEKDKIAQEELEKRAKRSKEEKIFREKAIKFLNAMKETQNLTERRYCSLIFKNEKQKNNCLELLCVFYINGIDDIEKNYLEVHKRLQIQETTVLRSMRILYDYIARYYGYVTWEFKNNEELKREKLQDFMEKIQNFEIK